MENTVSHGADGCALTEVVAIDGPAGAGKSTVARNAAAQLGFAFLDTGAMYRAATWWALEQGVDLGDSAAVEAATRALPLELREDGMLRVFVGERDVSAAIRTPEVTRCISRLDANPGVRDHLVGLQRAFAEAHGPTVAEGRDIGTVVFPRAKCKIYLDASIDERARRRADQLREQGLPVDLDALRADIEERDRKNMTRPIAPLRRADDAVSIDTTDLSIDQVVDAIVTQARAAL